MGFHGAKEDIYTSGKGKEKRYIFNKTRLYTFLNLSKIIVMVNWMYWMH